MALGETQRSVEGVLARFVIGQQHLLAHTSLIPQHGLDQPAPDPGASMGRMNQDVLKVGDGDAVTDDPGQADQFSAGSRGRYPQ